MVLSQSRGTSPYRLIVLRSIVYTHGIQHGALLNFSDPPGSNFGNGLNVDQPNFNGWLVDAYLSRSEYVDYYEVLRSEKPLRLVFYYTPAGYDPSDPTRAPSQLRLSTGTEPLEEGLADVSS